LAYGAATEPSAISTGQADVDEALLWAGFAAARVASDFCKFWLSLQCRMIGGVEAALLLLEDDAGAYVPAATWPGERQEFTNLVPVAEQALRERRGVVERAPGGAAHVAYPIEVKGQLWGGVVLALRPSSDAALQAALRRLHWGAGWVETLFHRRQAERDAQQLESAKLALQIVRSVGAARGLLGAAMTLASELSIRLDCRRVAVGVVKRRGARVLALSHAASLAGHSRIAASLANVMEEALDEGATMAYPAISKAEGRVAVAHRDHCRDHRMAAVLSVLIAYAGAPIGVITIERETSEPFDQQTVTQAESVAELVAPIFELQRDLHRPVSGRAVTELTALWHRLFGRGHATAKLVAVAAAGLLLWLGLAQGDYRIAGRATIEGVVQRAIVAPFDGFIATAPLRAGDVVEKGQVLATLDTREFELDALRYESERQQARLKQNEAEAKGDRANAAGYAASAAEADAQLALVKDKLARAQIIAPFRGLIVSGDLTQELGSPIERGKVMFEIAPLDSYRVIIKVDEREIARLKDGASGHLLLDGLSSDPLDFKVDKVIPIAVADDGGNEFRVEAALQSSDPRLRPGMEGVGKIDGGNASLVWIWAHPVFDWMRLTWWKWLP
jgi:multidrug resistance efflux pump